MRVELRSVMLVDGQCMDLGRLSFGGFHHVPDGLQERLVPIVVDALEDTIMRDASASDLARQRRLTGGWGADDSKFLSFMCVQWSHESV